MKISDNVILSNYCDNIRDLSFYAGEVVEIVNVNASNWLYVKSKTTNKEGYIPPEFVAQVKSVPVTNNVEESGAAKVLHEGLFS